MSPKIKSVIVTLNILAVGFEGVGLAEEPKEEEKVYKLGEVMVTATRTERAIADVPASVTVIGKEEIEASPFEKVEDILRTTAGLEVNYHYGMHTVGGTRPVNLRGTGGYGERTLVLVDGIPQNNANNGWVEWSQIPKEAVERIEVVRGPSSALYGSNAMGGVINIITERPKEARESMIEQTYGSMNTRTTKFIHKGKTGKFGYYLSGGYEETDGYIATKPQEPYDIERFRREDRVFAKLMYGIDELSSLALGFSRYHHKMGRGRKYFYGYTENNHYWLDWSRNEERIDWGVKLYVNDDEWDCNFDKSPTYDSLYRNEVIPMLAFGGSVQSSIDLSGWSTLILGIDYKHNDLEKKDTYYTVTRSSGSEGKQSYPSFFLNDEMKLLDERLIVNFGGRYDWIKAYDGKNWDVGPGPPTGYSNDFSSKEWEQFSPKLGAVYHLSEVTTLRSSIGRGFKAPSLYELYTSLMRGPLYIECNPGLEPEKIVSYDLGLEH